jgi:hypothetical protein
MSGKVVLFTGATILGGLIGHIFRETGWALTIETAVDKVAHAAGMERPEMIAAATPYIIAIAAAYGLLILGVRLGEQNRKNRPDFGIEFDAADDRFVDVLTDRVRYFVGLRNASDQTIMLPSMRAHNSEFTNQILSECDPYNWGQPVGAMIIYAGGAIDPGGMELIELFSLSNDQTSHGELLLEEHRFTLETRGRNAKSLCVEFEYNPEKFPRIKKC